MHASMYTRVAKQAGNSHYMGSILGAVTIVSLKRREAPLAGLPRVMTLSNNC